MPARRRTVEREGGERGARACCEGIIEGRLDRRPTRERPRPTTVTFSALAGPPGRVVIPGEPTARSVAA